MELSERTLQVLQNFSGINGNIFINEGNVLRTVSESRTVLAKATLDNDFPKSFGIYDLREFLSVLSLVDSTSVSFEDDFARISDSSGRSKIKYFYSAPETLTSPKGGDIALPSEDAWFELDAGTLTKIKSAATALGHNEVNVTLHNGIIRLTVTDNEDSTSHEFDIDMNGYSECEDMKAVFNIANLRLLESGNYRVSLSEKFISHFVNTESNMEYWVALQKSSKF